MTTRYVIQCSITGKYLIGSKSKHADEGDISWAQVYHTLGGAKTAKAAIQQSFNYWYDGSYYKAGKPSWMHRPHKPEPEYKRNFEIKVMK